MESNQRPRSKFEVVIHEGKPARKYPDGTIRGEHGHILAISPERQRAMIERRNQLAKSAIIKGIKKATGQNRFYDALVALAEKRVEVAMRDKGRAGNDAFRQLLLMIDAYQPNQRVEVKQNVQNNTVNFELPAAYYEALKQLRDDGIIEGSFDDDDQG